MKTRAHLLILVLAVSALPLSVCKATIVLQDFTNGDTSAAEITGSTPVVGTPWTENDGASPPALTYGFTTGGAAEATPYSIYTDGAGRFIQAGFSTNHSSFIALGSGKVLTVSFYIINFGANWNTNSGGYAGVSLYTNYNGTAGSGSEQEFIGEPNGANQVGLDGNTTGNHDEGPGVPATVTFTYAYDTGAWTFTTSGGVNISGTGIAHQAFNAVRIANGNGGDIDLNDFTVDISSLSVVTFFSQTPGIGAYSASRTNAISVQTADGSFPVNTNTIVMQVDGSAVTPSITKPSNITTISYVPISAFSPGSLHTVLVTLADSNGTHYTNTWSFTTDYPSLPVTLAGPFTTGGGNDLIIFTNNPDDWVSTNYNSSSSRTLYTRYSMEFSNLNGKPANLGFGGLHFELGNTEQLLVGDDAGSTNWSYDADTGGAADLNITNSTLPINFGEWHTIVVRTDYVPGENDNVTIYFDPDFTQTEANQNPQNTTTLSTPVTFDNIRLRCGNGTASATWSNIIVAATPDGVGFQPNVQATFEGYVPGQNAVSAPVNSPVSVEALFGSYGFSSNTVTFNLDGNNVTPTFVVTTNSITMTYQPPSPFVAGSSHTATVSLIDSNGTPYSTSWSFSVDSYPTLPVTIAGPIDVTGGGLGTTIFGPTNEWIAGNYETSSTNTLYTRFSMVFFANNGTPGTFGGLHFYQDLTEHLITGENFSSTNWSLDCAAGGGIGEADLLPVTPIVLNQYHTIVIKSVYSSNAPTAETIWLDPDFTKTEANQPQAPLTFTMNNTFDTVRLRCGNGSAYDEFSNIVIAATAPGVGFAAQPATAVLSVTSSGNLSWTSTGTLQQAPAVTGPWTDSGNQSNPQVIVTTNSAMFFRLRQ